MTAQPPAVALARPTVAQQLGRGSHGRRSSASGPHADRSSAPDDHLVATLFRPRALSRRASTRKPQAAHVLQPRPRRCGTASTPHRRGSCDAPRRSCGVLCHEADRGTSGQPDSDEWGAWSGPGRALSEYSHHLLESGQPQRVAHLFANEKYVAARLSTELSDDAYRVQRRQIRDELTHIAREARTEVPSEQLGQALGVLVRTGFDKVSGLHQEGPNTYVTPRGGQSWSRGKLLLVSAVQAAGEVIAARPEILPAAVPLFDRIQAFLRHPASMQDDAEHSGEYTGNTLYNTMEGTFETLRAHAEPELFHWVQEWEAFLADDRYPM
jgi:hypothetical protein